MTLSDMPFTVTDWARVPATTHPGQTGTAVWRTRQVGAIRIRMVEYSANYLADHWCQKGHIILCVSGVLQTDLADGRSFILQPGMTYEVGDDDVAHRSRTDVGATLFIVD